ncbi:MAG: lysophospholipid acyltransferase family protein [Oceanihabitans sp.]
MQLLAFLLIYPVLWCISILPFPIFYLFSDFIYLIVYYIIGYRKKTVWDNLVLVFPEKSEKEIASIRKKFYKHMCDMFLEMIKTMTISRKQLLKRFVIKNPEELKRLEALDKSIIAMYGHYASYEWSMVVENYINFKGVAIYKKIANPYFDRLVRKIRTRYNTSLISSKKAINSILEFDKNNVKSINAFLSDQSPRISKAYHWTNFMNIKVPCFTGAEMLAKKLDFSVTYLHITKVKRGHYEAEFITLADNAREFKDYELTDIFHKKLEAQIYKAPEFYLWTHKRWKHKDKAPKD